MEGSVLGGFSHCPRSTSGAVATNLQRHTSARGIETGIQKAASRTRRVPLIVSADSAWFDTVPIGKREKKSSDCIRYCREDLIIDGSNTMQPKRQDHEPPYAVAGLGWRYHHLGIPTTVPRSNERYLPHLRMHVSGFDTSPFGIEWMRFDEDSPISELIKTVPHIAFEVDDLNAALVGQTLLGEISSPSDGVRVAMIIDDGMPIELLEFADAGGAQK